MLDKTIIEKCEQFIKQKDILERKLADQNIINNQQEYKDLIKEYNRTSEIVKLFLTIKENEKKLEELEKEKNSEDLDFRLLVQEEISNLQKNNSDCERKLFDLIIPEDPSSSKNIILEIRAGTGGEEAALFAADLFRMYCRYAARKNWKTEILSINNTGLKGIKEVICYISGKDVYKYLKYESGVHRVQRVPDTEASGRIHTSAATVAILPEAEEIDVKIDPKDLEIETCRASGHGGQHLQKTDSAVRIKHLPTGLVVECQDERSQIKNRERAMKILRARLYDMQLQQQQENIANLRKNQVKTGDRSEKIRTYNFPQNRVTDHRINLSLYNLQEVLDGDLEPLIDALLQNELKEKLVMLVA